MLEDLPPADSSEGFEDTQGRLKVDEIGLVRRAKALGGTLASLRRPPAVVKAK